MLNNYFKLSIRLLLRNPFFTLINVLSLSIGFAAFYMLWPYTQSELKSDQFHPGYDRIARLSWHHRWTDNGRTWHEFHNALNFCGIGKRIATEYSEVSELTRFVSQKHLTKSIYGYDSQLFLTVFNSDSTKEYFSEENAGLADANFFQFFAFPLISGDPAKVLSEPGSIVLSQRHSIKYFGDKNPINAIVYLNDSLPMKVTGVFKDLPRNTHFKFDMVATTAGRDDIDRPFTKHLFKNWMGCNYIKINAGVDFSNLQTKLDAQRKELYDNWENTDARVLIEPLEDVAFTDPIDNPFIYKSRTALTILRALSVMILLLAWINYICLSITTLHKRLPEVGTRKVVGASTSNFMVQFFVESALINGISLGLSVTLVQLARIPTEYLLHFYVADWSEVIRQHNFVFIVVPLLGVFVTGIYPVLVSTKKGTIELLRRLRTVQIPWWIQGMTTFQYASAVVLLIWIGVAYFQLDYILNKNTGISKGGILTAECPRRGTEHSYYKLDHFVSEAHRIPGVLQATLSKSVMGDNTGAPFFVQRKVGGIELGVFTNGMVDENFIDLFGIQLLAGRNFQPDNPSNANSILISRLAAERLGFATPEECIGNRIMLPRNNANDVEIIGVYEEYEFEPFFTDDQLKGNGSAMTYKNTLVRNISPTRMSFKIDLNQASTIIPHLEKLYKETFPHDAFRWVFLDQNISQHYTQEQIVRNQIMLFTLLAIGIACLGLLGITANKAIVKTKEIGVRKVLGARTHQIAHIILNATAKQVVAGIIIGIPVAYYLVQGYLKRYSDQLTLHWWHYGLPVLLLLIIMFATILSIVIKAARTNPVESLRSE